MRLRFVFIVGLVFFGRAFAGELQSKALTDLLLKSRHVEATFTQIIRNPDGKVIKTSQGVMVLSRPGKFRWEVKSPMSQVLVTKDNKLYDYSPDLAQMTIRPIGDDSGISPASLLMSDDASLLARFTITQQDKRFVLTPKSQGGVVKSIILSFNKNNTLDNIEMEDYVGQKTIIHFSNILFPPKLGPAYFTIQHPSDVDVVNLTR